MHLRLLYLSSHYRKNLDFSWKAMEQAKANFERIAEWNEKLKEILNSEFKSSKTDNNHCEKHISMFEKAMDDDLNTPLALSALYDMITHVNKKIGLGEIDRPRAQKILNTFEKMNRIFGLRFPEKETKIPKEVKNLADTREEARKNNDFRKADKLRKKIEEKGYLVEDLAEKYKLKKK